MNKRALIICFSHLDRDPRVLRQVRWLQDDFEITTVGLSSSGYGRVSHINYTCAVKKRPTQKIVRAARLFTRDFESYYWSDEMSSLAAELGRESWDLIVANDIDALPLAVRSAGLRTRVIFDAHEYAPSEFSDDWKFRLLRRPLVEYLCRTYMMKADVVTTVGQGISELYLRNFGIQADIITNAAEYYDVRPSKVDTDRIRLIYHGVASPSRRTDLHIQMMAHIDARFELNLMLMGDPGYISELQREAGKNSRINFLPPVPFEEIVPFTNQFDVGVFLLPPTNPNYRYALPNKFFEYIQARLAIAVSPLKEMKQVVERFDLGVVSQDFSPDGMASAINGLTWEKIAGYKGNCHIHAKDLSAESNRIKLLELAAIRSDAASRVGR